MPEVSEEVFRIGQGEVISGAPSPLVNLLRRRRFDTRHRLLCGLGAFPQGDSSFDEPALLRRPELLKQRVDARLALIVVVAIDSHIISSRTDFALVGRARLVLRWSLALGLRHTRSASRLGASCLSKRTASDSAARAIASSRLDTPMSRNVAG